MKKKVALIITQEKLLKIFNHIYTLNVINILMLALPLEGSIESLSPGLEDSGELAGQGERLLVEFTEDLIDVSIL